jgi:hypothetical protein
VCVRAMVISLCDSGYCGDDRVATSSH